MQPVLSKHVKEPFSPDFYFLSGNSRYGGQTACLKNSQKCTGLFLFFQIGGQFPVERSQTDAEFVGGLFFITVHALDRPL